MGGTAATDLSIEDEVLVDLVAGSVTRDTLDAGELERGVGLLLGEHLETTGNPFLSLTRAGAGHRSGAPPGCGGGGGAKPPGCGAPACANWPEPYGAN